jgi:hypothetical protein
VDGYRIELEGANPAYVESYKKVALEAGLTRKQAEGLATKFYEQAKQNTQAEAERQRKASEETSKSITAELTKEWGADFEGNSRTVLEFTKGMTDVQFTSLLQRLLLQEARRVRGQP